MCYIDRVGVVLEQPYHPGHEEPWISSLLPMSYNNNGKLPIGCGTVASGYYGDKIDTRFVCEIR